MLALLGSAQREKPLMRDIKCISHLFIPLLASFAGCVFASEMDWQAYVLILFDTDEKQSWWYWRSKSAMMTHFALEVLDWTFITMLPAWSDPRRTGAEGRLLVCLWQWLDHSDVYLRSFIIHPQIDLWQGPQKTWTNMTNFESRRKDRDLSPFLKEGSQNPSTNVSIVSAKTKLHWATERGGRRRSESSFSLDILEQNQTNSLEYG